MSDFRLEQTDYIAFALKSEAMDRLVLNYEPVGWSDDGFEFVRHKDYHGIMVQFTNDLSFYGEARQYILDDFNLLGINSRLKLEKYEISEVSGALRYNLVYSGIVDYSQKTEDDHLVKVKFNSNELEDIIKAREDDEFDLSSMLSANDTAISQLEFDKVDISGIELSENVSLSLIKKQGFVVGNITGNIVYVDSDFSSGTGDYQLMVFRGGAIATPVLESNVDPENRISTPDTPEVYADPASKMFFVDSTTIGPDDNIYSRVTFSYTFEAFLKTVSHRGSDSKHRKEVKMVVHKFRKNTFTESYDLIEEVVLDSGVSNRNSSTRFYASGKLTFPALAYNEGLAIGFIFPPGEYTNSAKEIKIEAIIRELNLSIELLTTKPRTYNHDFLFFDNFLNRLLTVATGRNNLLSSRVFGRKNDGYNKDGKYSHVGIINGIAVRNFNKSNPLYKAPYASIKDIIKSSNAVFNTGVGIETIQGKQVFVLEDLKFFYINEVRISLDKQVSNVKRKVISKDFYSSIEVGYDKGGEYSNTIGLDEPNAIINWVTPITRNKAKYKITSSVRADDTGMELLRRIPASLYPDESDSKDDHLWFLDVKPDPANANGNWVQKTWEDILEFEPQGLSFSSTIKALLFLPSRMLRRHGWLIRSGFNERSNLKKNILFANSKTTPTLTTRFKNENNFINEGEPIRVDTLDKPITFPETIEFTYPFSDELVNKFLDKSDFLYNEEIVNVPNYYFKIEFKFSDNKLGYGYIKSFNPTENKIELILSNSK